MNNISKPDPVRLEIFKNLYQFIAEQMGIVLQNTAASVNIKERLDFSCAIFDASGSLVANAPHIPVHLGSMSASVTSLINHVGNEIKSGDVYLSNNPYNGGTHLPDVTAITPVFLSRGERRDTFVGRVSRLVLKDTPSDKKSVEPEGLFAQKPIFYVASRGHQADIGGITPGSMPPHSTKIKEEGILFDNFLLVAEGNFREEAVREILTNHTYPARNIPQNLADFKAQIAANNRGVRELLNMVEQYSLETVQAYMQFVQDNAELAVKGAIATLKDGKFSYAMDNGAEIKVKVTIERDNLRAVIDFTGTSAQQASNFNAPAAVTQAAVLYVFRTLVDDPIPLNAGCLKPIEIIIPEGCMLNPTYPAAVVAGNVETSQTIVDALYGALGIMAASQGTMNNFTFGNDRYQYYETICGGSGAGNGFNGTDAVQTHMTNSLLTDPEVLESRYPVILESFSIREGSQGKGKYSGGNGVVRKVRFLSSMTAGILSSHRVVPSFGLNDGEAGKVGKNYVIRQDQSIEVLGSTATVEMQPGDTFVIETPGGGGWGADVSRK
ncbi:MAG: hypothetical protein RLZZ574_1613 [Cyanobacteriota bacterium]|jgi:N-methylhydantoinase B